MDDFSEIGAIVVNLMRPDCTKKCIDSLLNEAPNIKVYLGNQSDADDGLKAYAELKGINYIQLPFDCGISISRNTLVDKIKEDGLKYVLWGDNDFVYDSRFRLNNALSILKKRKKIGIVGGAVIQDNQVRHYERLMYYDPRRKTMVFIPLEYTYPEPKYVGNIDYYECDMTFNFALAKIDLFNDKVRWNENIKVKFEHSAAFINFMTYSKYKCVYCPSMMVRHEHKNPDNYKQYRFRTSDSSAFAESMGIQTGFTVNEASWDFVNNIPINFRSMAINSNTFKAAEYYSQIQKTEEIKEEEFKIETSIKPPIVGIPDLLDCLYNYNYHLLETSCLDAVRYKELHLEPNVLYLGAIHPDRIIQFLLDNGFVLNDGFYQKETIKISCVTSYKRTKEAQLYNRKVKIPVPVVPYLQEKYGKNYEQYRR